MNQSLSYEFPQPIILAAQSGAMISLCTFQQRTDTQDALGQVDLQDWVDVTGLVGIPCIKSAYRPSAPDKGATMRTDSAIDTSSYRHVLLNGYYPAVLDQYQAVVDGTAFEIFAVEHDSQNTMTRLVVRLYKK